MDFSCIIHFEINYNIFEVWFSFIKTFFNWWCFISIPVTFIFSIIITPTTTYSYWFAIAFSFFMLKKVPNISNYMSLIASFSFFILKRFPISFIVMQSFSFSSLESLIMFSSFFFLIFFKPWTFHCYAL